MAAPRGISSSSMNGAAAGLGEFVRASFEGAKGLLTADCTEPTSGLLEGFSMRGSTRVQVFGEK